MRLWTSCDVSPAKWQRRGQRCERTSASICGKWSHASSSRGPSRILIEMWRRRPSWRYARLSASLVSWRNHEVKENLKICESQFTVSCHIIMCSTSESNICCGMASLVTHPRHISLYCSLHNAVRPLLILDLLYKGPFLARTFPMPWAIMGPLYTFLDSIRTVLCTGCHYF